MRALYYDAKRETETDEELVQHEHTTLLSLCACCRLLELLSSDSELGLLHRVYGARKDIMLGNQKKNKDHLYHRIHSETKVELGRSYSKSKGQ